MHVSDGMIRGTLLKVTDYTGFSGDPEKQKGNYLVLKFTPNEDLAEKITGGTASIAVELLGGDTGHPVTLDSDLNIVLLIKNQITQQIKVYVTEDDTVTTVVYRLDDLKLENKVRPTE